MFSNSIRPLLKGHTMNSLKVHNARTGFHARVKSNSLNREQCELLESAMSKIQMIDRQLDIAYYRHDYGRVSILEQQKKGMCELLHGEFQS